MKRALGNTAIEVSVLGFGGGHVGAAMSEADVERVLCGAIDLGITFFDTAPSYGLSEERFGRHLGGRDDVVVSTKCGYGVPGVPDWTGECIARGIDRALAVLRRPRIDVLHLHSCPLETLERDDVLRALDDARAAGKVRVAAYSGDGAPLAWAVTSGRFGAVQCSINLFDQRALDEAAAEAARRGVGVIAKRPLANVPWQYADRPVGSYAEAYWERMRAMEFEPADGDWAGTALRFAAFAPGVTCVIGGSRDLAHLAENARAIARGPLDEAEVRRLRQAFRAHDRGWVGQV